MKRRDLTFFALYLSLGGAVFAARTLRLSTTVTATVAVLVAISVPAANRFEKIMEEKSKIREKKERVGNFANDFGERANELGLQPAEEGDIIETFLNVDREPTKENVYEVAVSESFEDVEDYQRDIFHMLIICREINISERAVEQARLKTRIDNLMARFDLSGLDDPTLEFLGAYEEAQEAIRFGGNPPDELLGQKPNSERNTALQFATEFGTTEQLAVVLFDDKERSEELRRTLGRLIARGKLSSKSVNRETAQRIQEELEEMGSDSTKFMLFSQKIHYSDEVLNAIEKFPHIRPSYKNPDSGFPEVIEYMRIYVVYPEADYGSAQNFLDTEIKPNIPEDSPEDAFIAAMPLRLEELVIHPEVDEIDDFLTGTYEALNFLKTGASEDLSEIVSDRVMSEIGVSEVLATIPFNVLEPDLTDSEKELIINNYDTLREEFRVDRLFDWGDVSADKLTERLIELDDDPDTERWHEVVESITQQADKYSEAVYQP